MKVPSIIVDVLRCSGIPEVHLAFGIEASKDESGGWRASTPRGEIVLRALSGDRVRVEWAKGLTLGTLPFEGPAAAASHAIYLSCVKDSP